MELFFLVCIVCNLLYFLIHYDEIRAHSKLHIYIPGTHTYDAAKFCKGQENHLQPSKTLSAVRSQENVLLFLIFSCTESCLGPKWKHWKQNTWVMKPIKWKAEQAKPTQIKVVILHIYLVVSPIDFNRTHCCKSMTRTVGNSSLRFHVPANTMLRC